MALPAEVLGAKDKLARLTPIELLRQDIKTERLESVPLNLVQTEEEIVDSNHVAELGNSMKQKRGQLSPITVRARLATVDEKQVIVYDIIDGFHRTAGKRASLASIPSEQVREGIDTHIDATVLYGCTDEEFADQRIRAANSVQSVQFARVALWITKTWESTPWSKKGLTVVQAFSIYHHNSKNSSLGAITAEDVLEFKDWISKKCAIWRKSPGRVRNELMLANNSDPSLVKRARDIRGREAETVITQSKIAAIVKHLPGEPHFAAQREIMDFALTKKLGAKEIEELAAELKGVLEPRMYKFQYQREITRAYIRIKALGAGFSLVGEEQDDYLEIEMDDQSDDIQTKITANPEIPELTSSSSPHTEAGQTYSAKALGRGDTSNYESMQLRELDLEAAIAEISSGNFSEERWWVSALYLTPVERVCIDQGIYGGADWNQLASRLNIPVLDVVSHMTSGFAKRSLLLYQNPDGTNQLKSSSSEIKEDKD